MGTKKPFIKTPLFKLFVAVVVLFGLGTIAYLYMNGPSEGVINNNSSQAPSAAKSTLNKQHYGGKSVQFDYPGVYGAVQSSPPSGLVIEQLTMSAHSATGGTERITMTMKQAGSDTSTPEDSAYQLRARDTANYSVSTEAVGGSTATKFIKKDGSEITFFVPGAARYAIISGTTSGSSQKLSDDLDVVVSGFSWAD